MHTYIHTQIHHAHTTHRDEAEVKTNSYMLVFMGSDSTHIYKCVHISMHPHRMKICMAAHRDTNAHANIHRHNTHTGTYMHT